MLKYFKPVSRRTLQCLSSPWRLVSLSCRRTNGEDGKRQPGHLLETTLKAGAGAASFSHAQSLACVFTAPPDAVSPVPLGALPLDAAQGDGGHEQQPLSPCAPGNRRTGPPLPSGCSPASGQAQDAGCWGLRATSRNSAHPTGAIESNRGSGSVQFQLCPGRNQLGKSPPARRPARWPRHGHGQVPRSGRLGLASPGPAGRTHFHALLLAGRSRAFPPRRVRAALAGCPRAR